jgi:hypothetical protein
MAAMQQQQLDTNAAHSRDLTQCATRVQRSLQKEASEISTKLSRKEAECRALQQEQTLLKAKVALLEAAVKGSRERPALQSPPELENSDLNHLNRLTSNSGVYSDVMELQKELAAALNRVRERELQCRKYKEAVRTLKSRLIEEQQRRTEAEKSADVAKEQCSTAEARQQQVKQASREACAAAVRLAERRVVEAEGKVEKLEAALFQLERTVQNGKNVSQEVNLGRVKEGAKNEKENEDRLQKALALNIRLREELQQEKAQRAQQEILVASKTQALAEAEKRQKQLDGILKRLAAHQGL